ncbi:hypothetical protein PG985_011146 [Apiospora marii]|uniref:uncharacterized protein n=1 Tax=Apiospora marii TaxID=335849 RepID=UPI0031317245
MQLLHVAMIGLASLAKARPTVFRPEITGVPTTNGENITSNGSLSSDGTSIHDQSNGVCPDTYDAPALPQYVRDGIDYLRVKSSCQAGFQAGHTFCQRVSCSYKSAIYVCNENNEAPVSPSCDAVADHAQYILDNCQETAMGQHITQGQVGDIEGDYYVSVGYGDC